MLIFFDFDGVLADTLEMVLQIVQRENPAATLEHLRWVSDGNVFERLTELETTTPYRRVKDFDRHYAPLLLEQPLQAGMAEVVSQLATQHDMAIVSSSNGSAIAAFLKKHSIEQHFQCILGSDAHTSKVEKMSQSLLRYGHEASAAICITDTLGDVHEAHALGIRTIGVTWGWHDEARLVQGNPHAIAHTPGEVLLCVQNLSAEETS